MLRNGEMSGLVEVTLPLLVLKANLIIRGIVGRELGYSDDDLYIPVCFIQIKD